MSYHPLSHSTYSRFYEIAQKFKFPARAPIRANPNFASQFRLRNATRPFSETILPCMT